MTVYSDELAQKICDMLASGMSLREICRKDDKPNKSTVLRWLANNEQFRAQYARAREEQADAYADEIIEIADNASNDWMERNDDDNPGWQANHDHINRSRLRIDSRKWVASKLAPKKYGDKMDLNVAGKLDGISESALDAKLALLLKEAGVAASAGGAQAADSEDAT
jgi:hypothetical protein